MSDDEAQSSHHDDASEDEEGGKTEITKSEEVTDDVSNSSDIGIEMVGDDDNADIDDEDETY